MNAAFVEALLVGLNQEFNRELLWREYPTDQAGTPFARFWPGERGVFGEIGHWGDGGALGATTRSPGEVPARDLCSWCGPTCSGASRVSLLLAVRPTAPSGSSRRPAGPGSSRSFTAAGRRPHLPLRLHR